MQIIHAQDHTINVLVVVNVVVAVEDVSAMRNGFRYGFMDCLMNFFRFSGSWLVLRFAMTIEGE